MLGKNSIELRNVATNPKFSCWVNASAGSGKTTLLIQRLCNLLATTKNPERILCLTFSRAAAEEIHERVQKKITADKADSIKIQTIHGFCYDLLKKHSAYASKRLMETFEQQGLYDQAFADLLVEESIQSSLETILDQVHEDILKKQLIASLSTSHDQRDIGLRLKELYDLPEKILAPIPNEHLCEILSNHKITFNDSVPLEDQEYLLGFLLTKTLKPRKKILSVKDYSEEDINSVRNYAERVYHYLIQRKRYDHYQRSVSFNRLANFFQETYETLKNKNNFLDFQDLIHSTKHLFETDTFDQMSYQLQFSLEHLLLDEAQDTSEHQWQIIQCLFQTLAYGGSQNPTLFVVGDEKQSIYSFQGADLKVYQTMKNRAKEYFEKIQYLSFEENYRSQANILSFVNDAFSKDIDMGTEYHKAKSCKQPGTKVSFITYEKDDLEDLSWPIFDTQPTYSNPYLKVSTDITQKVLQYHAAGIAWHDIMILTKHRNRDFLDAISYVMQQQQVPCIINDQENLLELLPAKDFLSFAKFCLFPTDELNLAALLKSPVVQQIRILTENDIFTLCYQRSLNLSQQIEMNYPDVYHFLDSAINAVNKLSGHLFFQQLYVLSNIKDPILDHFMDEICKRQSLTFYGPIKLIQNLYQYPPRINFFSLENKNSVRINTVHGSKGQEAKVIILFDNNKETNLRQEYFLYDPVQQFYFLKPPQDIDTILTAGIKDIILNKHQQEDKRLLYVALTRAKEHLEIFINQDPKAHSWGQILQEKNLVKPLEAC